MKLLGTALLFTNALIVASELKREIKMNKTTEALKLAEEAIELSKTIYRTHGIAYPSIYIDVLAAIREALAEPVKQEPVAWVPLTDDDRKAAFESLPDALEGFMKKWGWLHFAKEIERRCKEKNK